MKRQRQTVKLSVRAKSAGSGEQSFQADVVPNAVYEGRELHERFADFLGLGAKDVHQAKTRIEELENFILRELEQGNRLDFGLVSFYPRLSAALPTRDSDPEDAGLHLRGAVKSRRSLSASLDEYLSAENPTATVSIRIYSVMAEDSPHCRMDEIPIGTVCGAVCHDVVIDPNRPDEGIWLEKPVKRRNQTHEVLARCEYLGVRNGLIRFRLNETVPPGRYMLSIGTRAGMGPAYRLRVARHQVRVV